MNNYDQWKLGHYETEREEEEKELTEEEEMIQQIEVLEKRVKEQEKTINFLLSKLEILKSKM